MDDAENLASKLSVVLSELGDVMNARKEQIEVFERSNHHD